MSRKWSLVAATGFLFLTILLLPAPARAHCDTLDGPVVAEARRALESGDVTAVLKWVRGEDERAIRAAFRETLAVRSRGEDAKALADRFFFETLVRIHRAGEGEPYAGLKPAGAPVDPAVAASDRALETGSVDALVKLVTEAAAAGIRARFREAAEAKKHAAESVDAGRKFVAAYVAFTHYAERLHGDAGRPAGHAHPPAGSHETGGEHGHAVSGRHAEGPS
jgi:hypothetical protein